MLYTSFTTPSLSPTSSASSSPYSAPGTPTPAAIYAAAPAQFMLPSGTTAITISIPQGLSIATRRVPPCATLETISYRWEDKTEMFPPTPDTTIHGRYLVQIPFLVVNHGLLDFMSLYPSLIYMCHIGPGDDKPTLTITIREYTHHIWGTFVHVKTTAPFVITQDNKRVYIDQSKGPYYPTQNYTFYRGKGVAQEVLREMYRLDDAATIANGGVVDDLGFRCTEGGRDLELCDRAWELLVLAVCCGKEVYEGRSPVV